MKQKNGFRFRLKEVKNKREDRKIQIGIKRKTDEERKVGK